jgi:hypothetical protein
MIMSATSESYLGILSREGFIGLTGCDNILVRFEHKLIRTVQYPVRSAGKTDREES